MHKTVQEARDALHKAYDLRDEAIRLEEEANQSLLDARQRLDEIIRRRMAEEYNVQRRLEDLDEAYDRQHA